MLTFITCLSSNCRLTPPFPYHPLRKEVHYARPPLEGLVVLLPLLDDTVSKSFIWDSSAEGICLFSPLSLTHWFVCLYQYGLTAPQELIFRERQEGSCHLCLCKGQGGRRRLMGTKSSCWPPSELQDSPHTSNSGPTIVNFLPQDHCKVLCVAELWAQSANVKPTMSNILLPPSVPTLAFVLDPRVPASSKSHTQCSWTLWVSILSRERRGPTTHSMASRTDLCPWWRMP